MMDRQLYVLALPGEAVTNVESKLQRNVSADAVVDGGPASVEPVSVEPERRSLAGQYRGRYAALMATELRELAAATGVGVVPLFDPGGRSDADGYYAVQSAAVGPLDARGPAIQGFDATLVKKGTRRSHRRAVETALSQPENGNDFGNATTGYVTAPAAATCVRWLDPVAGSTERPTAVATRTGEFGDVDVYDATASPYADPTLVYDLPYVEEGRVDCKVWDDHGRAKLDADGVTAWQRAFRTDHEFHGRPVVENGLLRLRFDEASNALSAWTWDADSSAWSSVSLGSSDWELADLDLVEVGMTAIRAQVTFRDPAQSPTAHFALDLALHRGYQGAQWFVPKNEQGPTPSGLVTLLDPVADGSVVDPQPSKGLVAREEVRK